MLMRRIFGPKPASISLPVNYLRTAFGINASPYMTTNSIAKNSLLIDMIRDAQNNFNFGGFFHEHISTSAMGTEQASAFSYEYRKHFNEHSSIVFGINTAPLEMVSVMYAPTCFLIEAEYKNQTLDVTKLHLPDLRAKGQNGMKHFSPEMNFENLSRALYYATLCMNQVGNGDPVNVKDNMQTAEAATDLAINKNFHQLKNPRPILLREPTTA